MHKKTVEDIDVSGLRVLLRVDFNVPMNTAGDISDDSRIKASLPTIKYLIDRDARLIVCSHLGRPDGKVIEGLRMKPVATRLSGLLGKPVESLTECIGPGVEEVVSKLKGGGIVLLENVRFHREEEANDPDFAKDLSRLADIYVNDAFGASHRAHASVVGIAKYLPAVSGFLMKKEIEALGGALEKPKRPFAAIIGGAKVSGKLAVLDNVIDKVDILFIGGGMMATFLQVKGCEVGSSLVEKDKLEYIRQLMQKAKLRGARIIMPHDAVVAEKLEAGAETKALPVTRIPKGWIIADIGPDTISDFSKELRKCQTVVWNGPLGVFEIPEFANGTHSIVRVLADLPATTIVGGGSTVEAVIEMGLAGKISHVSTGGGASLEFLEGKLLPGIAVLQDKL